MRPRLSPESAYSMDSSQTSAGGALPHARSQKGDELSAAEQARVLKRVTLRLIPLLFCCYIIAYIDRINVGFAKLQLQAALGIDPKVFGSI
jgi:sugar phosphate permease